VHPDGSGQCPDGRRDSRRRGRAARDAAVGAGRGWTWIDIDGSVCDDGTPTGIAVNPSPSAGPDGDLLIYFVGGGACWDSLTCAVLNSSTHGPFGRAQFEQQRSALNGAILDYDLFRTRFPQATRYLFNDSGPLFVGDTVPKSLRDAWYAQWSLQNTVAGECPARRPGTASVPSSDPAPASATQTPFGVSFLGTGVPLSASQTDSFHADFLSPRGGMGVLSPLRSIHSPPSEI
jgi:hypothetical protein